MLRSNEMDNHQVEILYNEDRDPNEVVDFKTLKSFLTRSTSNLRNQFVPSTDSSSSGFDNLKRSHSTSQINHSTRPHRFSFFSRTKSNLKMINPNVNINNLMGKKLIHVHQSDMLSSNQLQSTSLQRSTFTSTSSVALVTLPDSPSIDHLPNLASSEPVSSSPQDHLPGTLPIIEEIQPLSNLSNLLQINQSESQHSFETDFNSESNIGKPIESLTLQVTQSPLSAHLSDSNSSHQKITTTMEPSSSSQTTMDQIKNEDLHIQALRPRSPLNITKKSTLAENNSLLDQHLTGVIVVDQSRAASIEASERPSSRFSKVYHTEPIPKFEPSNLAERPSPSMSKSLEDMSNRKSSISAFPDRFQSFRSLMNRRTSVSSQMSNSIQPQPDLTSSHPPVELPLASSSSSPKTRKSKSVVKLVGRIGKKLRPKTKTQDVTGKSTKQSHYRPVSSLSSKVPVQTTEPDSETGYGDFTSPIASEFTHSRVVDSDMSYEKVTPIPLSSISGPNPQAEGLQDLSENPVSTPQSSSFGKVRPLPTPKPNLRSPHKYHLESDPESDSENDTRSQHKSNPSSFKPISHLNLSSIVNEFEESELIYQLPALPSPISPLCSLFTDPTRFDLEKPKRPSTSPGYAHLIATSQICDSKGKARMVHSVELTRLPTTEKGKVIASNSVDLQMSSRRSPNRISMDAHRPIDPSSALSSTSSQPTTLFGHPSDQTEVETPVSQISQEDHSNLPPRTRISLYPRSSLRLASSPTTISTLIPVNSDQITTSLHRQQSTSGTPRLQSSDSPKPLSASVDQITQTTPQKELFPLSSSAHSHSMEVTPWDYQDLPMRSTNGSFDHSPRFSPNAPSTSLLTSPKQESSCQRASTLFFGTLPGLKSNTQATITGQIGLYNRPTKFSGSLNGQIRQPSLKNELTLVKRSKSESRKDAFLHMNGSESTNVSKPIQTSRLYRWSFSSPNPSLLQDNITSNPISQSPTTTAIAQMIQTFTSPISFDHLPLKVCTSSHPLCDPNTEDQSDLISKIHSPTRLTAQPSSLWRSHSDSVPRKSSLFDDSGLKPNNSSTSQRFSRMITRSQSTANLILSDHQTSLNLNRRRGSCNEPNNKNSNNLELPPRPKTAAPSSMSGTTVPIKAESPVKLKLLDRNGEESNVEYLERLGETIEKSMIVSALAASSDPFHLSSIITYLDSFEFAHDPIDLALRKLLMSVSLPKETQQIDRVMEAFAKRYVTCNPKLFGSSDQVYILAFSIIMLHTDAFNKHNRGKMSRADYVKNTRMDGVPNEVLEYIYDNVTYTPFVFVEEDRDITGQKIEIPPETSNTTSFFSNLGSSTNSNSIGIGGGSLRETKKQANDPYLMISRGLTHQFRIDLSSLIPSRNPFSFIGTQSFLDSNRLRKSFTVSPLIQIINTSKSSNSMINKIIPEVPSSHEDSFGLSGGIDESLMINLKAIKVGLVYRKEVLSGDDGQSGNGTGLIKNVTSGYNKKWKEWCLILTRSQLLFMKDTSLVDELQQSFYEANRMNLDNHDEQLVVRITGLKPDSVFSLEDGIALFDFTYKRRPHTFRLLLGKEQQQYLIEVSDENEMNSWITHINFAATFKSTDLPFRIWQGSDHPLSHSTSSIGGNSLNLGKSRGSMSSSFGGKSMGGYQTAEEEEMAIMERRNDRSRRTSDSINGSYKSRSIKRRGSLVHHQTGRSETPERLNRNGNVNEPLTPGSGIGMRRGSVNLVRYEMVKNKIKEIENEIIKLKTELNEDLRIARNLAVLTPFQISNKNRLQLSILPLADRIRIYRLNLSKLICYREVLFKDSLIDKPMIGLLNNSIVSPPSSTKPQHEKEEKEEQEGTEEVYTPKSSALPLTLGTSIPTTTTTTTTNGSIIEEIESNQMNSINENQTNQMNSPISQKQIISNPKSEVKVIIESEVIGLIPEAESKTRPITPSSREKIIKSSTSINILPGRPSSSSDHHHQTQTQIKSPLNEKFPLVSPIKKNGWIGRKFTSNVRPATANTLNTGNGVGNANGRIGASDASSKRLTQAWGLP